MADASVVVDVLPDFLWDTRRETWSVPDSGTEVRWTVPVDSLEAVPAVERAGGGPEDAPLATRAVGATLARGAPAPTARAAASRLTRGRRVGRRAAAAEALPATATVDAATTAFVMESTLAAFPPESHDVRRCGTAVTVAHRASGRRPV
jgi:hypothetical protein